MLSTFRQSYGDSAVLASHLESLVSGDRLFSTSNEQAYALAWALTFYLTDRHPDAFRSLVVRYTSRTPFAVYESADRSLDFRRDVGIDFSMLAAQMQQFLSGIR